MLHEQIALHTCIASTANTNPTVPPARKLTSISMSSSAAKSLKSGLSRVQDLKKSLSQKIVALSANARQSPTCSTSESAVEVVAEQCASVERHVLEQQ